MTCPNINSPQWKQLVSVKGEKAAYYLWDKYEGNVPSEILQVANEQDTDFDKWISERKKEAERTLETRLKQLLAQYNINFKVVDKIRDENGQVLDIAAKTDFLLKTIEIAEGKGDGTVLPEEVAHMFVEMMDTKSHLYKTMYDKIVNYPVYAEVQAKYKGVYNEDQMRREAMGKLIGSEIIKQSNTLDAKQRDTLDKWWNLVWAKLKNLFVSMPKTAIQEAKKEYDEYSYFAKEVLKGTDSDLNFNIYNVRQTDFLYSATPTATAEQMNTLDLIKKQAENIVLKDNGQKRAYFKGTQELGESVTTKRDKLFDKKRFVNGQTPEQLKKRDRAGETGNKIHADLENIVKRLLMKDSLVQKEIKTDPATYVKLEKYVKQLETLYKTKYPGTVFLAEQIVYNAKTNTPGTIDLMAILPDGSVDIYDWKTMEISNREKLDFGGPAYYKTEKYEWQLNAYVDALRNSGVKKFNKARYVPIETKYTKNQAGEVVFKSINITDLTSTESSYLDMVPVRDEKTHIQAFDRLIEQLTSLHDEVKKSKPANEAETIRKNQRMKSLTGAIRDLQIRHSLTGFISNAKIEFTTMEALLKNDKLEEKELADMYDRLKVYRDLNTRFAKLYRNNTIPSEDAKKLAQIERQAAEIGSIVNEKIDILIQNAAYSANEDVSQENLAKQKGLGAMDRFFTSLSRIDHPIFRTMWSLIDKQKRQIREENQKLQEEIREKLDALQTWASNKGLKGTDIFNSMVDKKTGKLISKFSSNFYEEREKRAAKGDYDWIKNNVVVDEQGLKEYIKEKKKRVMEHTFSVDKSTNEAIKAIKIKEIDENFNIFENPKAYGYPKNKFIKPLPKWYSSEYQALLRPENKAAFDFYQLFVSKMKEYSEFIPMSRDDKWVNPERFIPNVKADFRETLMNMGGTRAIKGIGGSIDDMFAYQYNEDPSFGNINEFTGQFERTVPIYYTTELKPDEKSYDLGRVLAMYGGMAHNYKHMNAIEGTVRGLRNALEDSKEAAVDGSGKTLSGLYDNKIVKKVISADTLTLFNNFMDYYLYGIKNKDNWGYFTRTKKEVNPETGEVTETQVKYSNNKIASSVIQWFSAKALGLNFVSIGANFVGSQVNGMIMAQGGNYFSKRQWLKAMSRVTKGNFDPKALTILEAMNMKADRDSRDEINELSVNDTVRKASIDKFFYFQAKTDELIYDTAILALLESHGLDANGKVKKLKHLPEGTPSLYEKIEIVDGKLDLKKHISQEEILKLRNKAFALGEKMVGMSNRDNLSGWRLTLAGKALMQFRGWIPRTVGARFGKTRYDSELEAVEQGRYRTLANQLFTKNFIPLLGELAVGFAAGEFGQNTKDRARLLYAKYLDENPNVDPNVITEEMYMDMYESNLKTAAMEAVLIGAFTLLLMGIKEGLADMDDDDDKKLKAQAMKAIGRTIDELTFFMNPTSFQSITRGVLPVSSFLTDIFNFFGDITKETYGTVTGDEKMTEKAKPVTRFMRLFPGTNEYWKWFGDEETKDATK